MSTLVFRYGLLAPTERPELVREQMRLAHRYKNALIEIERQRRARSREVELASDAVDVAQKEYEGAVDVEKTAAQAVKSARAGTRSRSETAAMRAALVAARAEKKLARLRWSDARRASREDPEIVAARKAASATAAEATRAAREANGLHWGTGAIVDDAVKAASKEPLFVMGEPSDPKFHRWAGEGTVGVQVHQKGEHGEGLSVGEIMTATGDAAKWLHIVPTAQRIEKPARTDQRLRDALKISTERTCVT